MRDNSNPEDYLFDSGSIKLTESEPLSSNSYIYIDLETDENSRRAARSRQQRAYPQQGENMQPKQKKPKRKGADAQPMAAPRVNRGSEPALHVIIEHETPYDEFDYEPEIPDAASVASSTPASPDLTDAGMASLLGSIPDLTQQYPAASPWQPQQMQQAQPMQGAQQPTYPAQQMQQQVQPAQPGYPMGAVQPVQPAQPVSQQGAQPVQPAQTVQQHASQQGAPLQGSQPIVHQYTQPYIQDAYSVPQAQASYQTMQPMQPMASAVVGGFVQPDIALQGAQASAQNPQQAYSSHAAQPDRPIDDRTGKPGSRSDAASRAAESVSADGKVVRRPWGSADSSASAQQASSAADPYIQPNAPVSAASPSINLQDNIYGYSAHPEPTQSHRGMMSWKKSGPEPKDLNHAFGSATVPITMQYEPYPAADRPEVRISAPQADAFDLRDKSPVSAEPLASEKPKVKEKPLKINVGTHGKVSTQDHLTISRESIEQLSREQEAKASAIKTMSSRTGSPRQEAASSAKAQRTSETSASRGSSVSGASAPGRSKAGSASKESYIDSLGAPLLDEAALEESSMFEEPPTSIADGMKAADKHRKKHRKGIIAAVFLIIIAAVIAVLFVLNMTGQINLNSLIGGVFPQQSGVSQSSSAATSSSGAASSSSKSDQSGTVIYEYTANTSSGVEYKVKETVTFSSDGDCESTQMEYEFPNAADLEALLSNLSRDYGSDYELLSQNGNSATVVINIGNLKLDREEYEDALRYSVEDLMILKK